MERILLRITKLLRHVVAEPTLNLFDEIGISGVIGKFKADRPLDFPVTADPGPVIPAR
jgi:hypothetical protein